jgi:ammonium transporter, Amt family
VLELRQLIVLLIKQRKMDNLTIFETIDEAFRYFPHNESFAIPGTYDISVQDASWILTSTLIFFTMHTGLALIEVGIVGEKNHVNVMMKNFVDFCAGGLAFWIFGFGLMFGRGKFTNPFFGAGDFFVNAQASDPLMGQVVTFYFFQMSFSTTAMTIVSGAVAERFKFTAYILFSFLFTFVYSIGSGWIWGSHGWLKNIGVVDFAGAGPIHIIAGASGEFCET